MPAKRIPRPAARPTSAEDLCNWLEHLCLSSESRGLGGFELAECTDLLDAFPQLAATENHSVKAAHFRQRVRELRDGQRDADGLLALVGLSPDTLRVDRAHRRLIARNALLMGEEAFVGRYDRLLLRDLAHDLWALRDAASGVTTDAD